MSNCDYDLFGMEGGSLLKTHGATQCAGTFCALHNPSEHPLARARLMWDYSRNLCVRICAHGVWHPDPDDIAFKHRATSAAWASALELHPCDGCCTHLFSFPKLRHQGAAQLPLASTVTLWDKAKWALIAFGLWVKSFFRR